MRGLLEAVSLLTRVPVRSRGDLKSALPWLPVVGGVIGAAVAGTYAVSLLRLPELASAALAVGGGILTTGALHEDGFADTADAFGAGVDRERTFEILKDPRLGTYGVVAVVLSILLRVAAVASLNPWAAFAGLTAAHALSRTSGLVMMMLAPALPSSTLGASYATALTPRAFAVAVAVTAAISVGTLGPWALVAAAIGTGVTACVARRSTSRIGGITGDLLGTAEQLTQIGVFLLVAAIPDQVPWWKP